MNYLERSHLIASEIRREHRNGLVFQRQNVQTTRDSQISSLGSYYSPTLGRELFVGLKELTSSSATLRTVFNIAVAESENAKHRAALRDESDEAFSPVSSAFFILLRNRRNGEVGMLFEDVSEGGKIAVIEPESENDPLRKIIGDPKDNDSEFSLIFIVHTGVKVENEVRIVDFSPLIQSEVSGKDPHKLKNMHDIMLGGKLPVVTLRRAIK